MVCCVLYVVVRYTVLWVLPVQFGVHSNDFYLDVVYHLQEQGKAIPLIVESCIRYINLHGQSHTHTHTFQFM